MTRRSGTCLLALTAVLMAQSVSAQTAGTGAAGTTGSAPATQIGNIGIELLKSGTDDYPQAARTNWAVPIGRKTCTSTTNKTITVGIRGLVSGGTFPYLEAWLGTANNCEQGDRGTRASGTAVCSKLNIPNVSERQVANRVNYQVTVELGPTCDAEGTRPIYFLQLPSEGSNATATSYGVLNLKVDTTVPPTPTNVNGSSGQTVIPLTWTANTYDTLNYWVLADATDDEVDAGTGENVLDGINMDCPSANLRAGKDFDVTAIPKGIIYAHEEGPGKHSHDFNGQQFGTKKAVAAVVMAEDQAGNLSPMSDVKCLYVKETTGFWKRYQDDASDPVSQGCACSAPGAPGAHRNALVALPVLLVLGWAGVRSRTRRRAR